MNREIGRTASNIMIKSCKAVVEEGASVRKASRDYGVSRRTFDRYLKKLKDGKIQPHNFEPNNSVRKIFTSEEEKTLSEYFIKSAKLAYELALKYNKNIPQNWKKEEKACRKWITSFMKTNKNISLRKPEATSLARCSGFNKEAVTQFYKNLKKTYNKLKIDPENIYNVDETALTTVQAPAKIITETGSKQVGQITWAERGVLFTMIGAISVIGNSIPPLLVFPRKCYKDHILNGAPVGSVGCAKTSG